MLKRKAMNEAIYAGEYDENGFVIKGGHVFDREGHDMHPNEKRYKTNRIDFKYLDVKPIDLYKTYKKPYTHKTLYCVVNERGNIFDTNFDLISSYFLLVDNDPENLIYDTMNAPAGCECLLLRYNPECDNIFLKEKSDEFAGLVTRGKNESIFLNIDVTIQKLQSGEYTFTSKYTKSVVVFPDGEYKFDNVMPFIMYSPKHQEYKRIFMSSHCGYDPNSVIVTKKGKYNIIWIDVATERYKYLHYVFDEWVDDIYHVGSIVIGEKSGQKYVVWYGDLIPVDRVYRGNWSTIIIEYNKKWNILQIGYETPFSDEWFDNMCDFGTDDFEGDENDLSLYPIVELDGKYTYIDLENFNYLFNMWFDDAEPYYEERGKYMFDVVRNGKNKTLTHHRW